MSYFVSAELSNSLHHKFYWESNFAELDILGWREARMVSFNLGKNAFAEENPALIHMRQLL